MSEHLTPLDICLHLIGPAPVLGEIAGRTRFAPYQWERGSRLRPAGHIPIEAAMRIYQHARARGIPLRAEYLLTGVSRADLDRHLAAQACAAVPGVAAE